MSQIPSPRAVKALSPQEDTRLRFSLAGMFGLFTLIAIQVALCSAHPWLLLVLPPVTLAIVRTLLVANYRKQTAQPVTAAEAYDLFVATLLHVGIYALLLGMVVIGGFAFGGFAQIFLTQDAGSYLIGGTSGVVIGIALTGLATWRSIYANWMYDLRGPTQVILTAPKHE